MPNIMRALRAEIRKVARDESKRAAKASRAELRSLRRELTAVERRLAGVAAASRIRARAAGQGAILAVNPGDGRRARFAPALVRKHREKLGMSRKAYAKLLGVSSLSVYFWETGRTRPRRDTILAWQDLRKRGARELRALAGGGPFARNASSARTASSRSAASRRAGSTKKRRRASRRKAKRR